MTGDPERIDIVIQRVDRLVVDIEVIKFDPFNPSNRLADAHSFANEHASFFS